MMIDTTNLEKQLDALAKKLNVLGLTAAASEFEVLSYRLSTGDYVAIADSPTDTNEADIELLNATKRELDFK